jgi:hypothetical protein
MSDEPSDAMPEENDSRTLLMKEVAAQMDAVDADLGDDYEIMDAIVLLRVKLPSGDSMLRVRAINVALYEGLGMLEVAKDHLKVLAAGAEEED